MQSATKVKKSIAVAGTIIVDKINEISAYPKEGELTKILKQSTAVGGCVPNVAIDLKRLCPDLTVKAVGKVGEDQDGEYVKLELEKYSVETVGVKTSQDATDFTQVMSVKGGQRTFFTYSGAGAEFGYNDIDFETLGADMLHLGYFLLLEKVDNGDGERILKKAKELGVKTSIDLVSENSDRYSTVLPCLKYVDNLIINETEAGALTGITPTLENLEQIAKKLRELGVSERVIIHTPELGLCLSDNGLTSLTSYRLPNGFIKGTTGAGDAYCAGALFAISQSLCDQEILEIATVCATCSLTQKDAVSGIEQLSKMQNRCKDFERK